MRNERATAPAASLILLIGRLYGKSRTPGGMSSLILRVEPRSKGVLAAAAGWSRDTVAARLASLMDSGLVVERDEERGDRSQPYARYEINPHAASIFVTRFDPEFVEAFICRLDGTILASDRHELIGEPGAVGAVKELEAMLARLLLKPPACADAIAAMIVDVELLDQASACNRLVDLVTLKIQVAHALAQ